MNGSQNYEWTFNNENLPVSESVTHLGIQRCPTITATSQETIEKRIYANGSWTSWSDWCEPESLNPLSTNLRYSKTFIWSGNIVINFGRYTKS